MTEHAGKLRDARLRKRILATLHMARQAPEAGLSGRLLIDCVEGAMASGQGFTGDEHAMGLLRDLDNAGLASIKSLPRRRGQSNGVDFVFAAITDKGAQLIAEAIPPHPLVDDERITE